MGRLIITFLVVSLLAACNVSVPPNLDKNHWSPYKDIYKIDALQVRPAEFYCAGNSYFNGRPIVRNEVVKYVEEVSKLYPRPPILLSIDNGYKSRCAILSELIAETGICNDGKCYYKFAN